MKATHKFSQFTYWNLETPPSNNDAIAKAMQWINIASAVSDKFTAWNSLTMGLNLSLLNTNFFAYFLKC